jgi:hypothetical protein
MLIILKNNKGGEITRMIDPQWILRIFEAIHIDSRVNRVQETHLMDQWGYTPFAWLKNRMIKKYHNMSFCGLVTGTDNEVRLKAIQTVRLICRGFLEEEKGGEYDFPLNQVRVLDLEKFLYRNMW